MRLEQSAEPIFARHETFHPRHGWFKKAHDAAASDPGVFRDDEATVILGVGKNMVRAIRHWGLAFRVLTEVPNPDRPRRPLAAPSRIGDTVFAEGGWDPYLESPGTSWLLHWWLLAPPSLASVWWSAFHNFAAIEFDEEDLTHFVADEIEGVSGWNSPHPRSLKKDVSCLVRMYAPPKPSKRDSLDDLFDCPFRELGIISSVASEPGRFRFNVGEKPTLPPAVALFAAFDFLARTDAHAQTVTISRLATEPGGPGRAFKLTEDALTDLLTSASSATADVEISHAAGVPQLTFTRHPAELATEILFDHYRSFSKTSRRATGLIAGRGADTEVGSPEPLALEFDEIATSEPLDGDPPEDALERIAWHQRRVDAGLAEVSQ